MIYLFVFLSENIRALKRKEKYKYLEMLKVDTMMQTKIIKMIPENKKVS